MPRDGGTIFLVSSFNPWSELLANESAEQIHQSYQLYRKNFVKRGARH
jgi:hypothetical protein